MIELTYATSSYQRDRGDLPNLPIINMFAEQSPAEAAVVLQSRPGLETAGLTMGSGPVRGLFQTDGVLSNQVFGISGSSLYSNTTNLGTIDGDGPVSFGGYETTVFVNAGEGVWKYDGTFGNVAFPDGADVSRICVAASRLVCIRKDTGKFYWSDALDSAIDALAFATAENAPDTLKDVLFIGDTLVLFGAETIEFWPVSSADPDFPFVPLIGRVFPVGIRAPGCAVKLGSSFAWVTNENQICLGNPNEIISTTGIQALLEGSSSALLWTFRVDSEEFLALRIDNATWAMSSRSGQWSELTSYGEDNWLPQCFDANYFGSSSDGQLLRWSDGHRDLGDVLERRFRAWLPLNDEGISIFVLSLRSNPGQTLDLAGIYSDPVVELRTSRDGGFTWSAWRRRSLGRKGEYRTRTKWRTLGTFGYPGMMIEIRMTDPMSFRVSGVTANDTRGGI